MRRIISMVTVALVMAAMMLAIAMPAFAFVGGGSPDDKECNTNIDGTISCQGGGGVNQPGEPPSGGYPTGSGNHNTYDPATGDFTTSGGGGGQRITYDENGQEVADPGGAGVHCEYNGITGVWDCHGAPGTFADS